MRAEYINPFISSLTTTFSKMIHCDLKRGQIHLSPAQCETQHPEMGALRRSLAATRTEGRSQTDPTISRDLPQSFR